MNYNSAIILGVLTVVCLLLAYEFVSFDSNVNPVEEFATFSVS